MRRTSTERERPPEGAEPSSSRQTHNQRRSPVSYDTETINKDIARYALNVLRDRVPDCDSGCDSESQTGLPLLRRKLQPEHISEGLRATLPCRFEHFLCRLLHPSPSSTSASKVLVILDMAHNEGGMEALVWKLKHFYPKRRYR
jgi:folylpolyglutamate synthase/dihydropteroate synthase